jgi:DNA-binding transcriptional MerR regulator
MTFTRLNSQETVMQVSELAKRVEIPAHVIRYYTQVGLLQPVRNPRNQYRDYTDSDIYRLRFIRRAGWLGFTLREIKLILRDADNGRSPCKEVREIIKSRAVEVRQRLEELHSLQMRVTEALFRWDSMPDRPPTNESLCHLIDTFAEAEVA